MKNKLKIVSVILFAFVLIPQIVFASWWNPFSWNWSSLLKKSPSVVQPVTIVQPTPVAITPNPFLKILTTNDSTSLDKLIKDSKPKSATPKSNKNPVPNEIQQSHENNVNTPTVVTESPDITNSRQNLESLFHDQIIAFKQEIAMQSLFSGSIGPKISELNDDIAHNDGVEMGDPDYATLGQYLDKLYNSQIDLENKYGNAETTSINWLQDSESKQEAILAQLPSLTTKDELDNQMKNYQFYKDNLQQEKTLMGSWSKNVDKYQAEVQGIMDGIGGKLNAETAIPVVQPPSSPPVFIPSSSVPPFSINCVTSPRDMMGEIITSCH